MVCISAALRCGPRLDTRPFERDPFPELALVASSVLVPAVCFRFMVQTPYRKREQFIVAKCMLTHSSSMMIVTPAGQEGRPTMLRLYDRGAVHYTLQRAKVPAFQHRRFARRPTWQRLSGLVGELLVCGRRHLVFGASLPNQLFGLAIPAPAGGTGRESATRPASTPAPQIPNEALVALRAAGESAAGHEDASTQRLDAWPRRRTPARHGLDTRRRVLTRGSEPIYDGSLATRDAVVVTINHRLVRSAFLRSRLCRR
jgi:hypothetical protein